MITHTVWLKNRTTTHALPSEKTPFEILYNRKLDLGSLKEWGSKVWVHTMDGTKLDGRLKVGKWIGFDKASNGHHIYWPDRCSISIEFSIKFVNDDMIIPSTLSDVPIQEESHRENQSANLQHTLETRSNRENESKNSQLTSEPEPQSNKPKKIFQLQITTLKHLKTQLSQISGLVLHSIASPMSFLHLKVIK